MARQRPMRLVMGQCIVEIHRIVIREVQYLLEVNRCRNEEVIVKGNFGWEWPIWVGRLSVCNGAMHTGVDRIVNHKFQYQFEVNRCRNEEIIVKDNFGWVWSMKAGCPRIDRIVIREGSDQNSKKVFPRPLKRPLPGRLNFEIRFQGSMARTDRQTDGLTDGGDNHNIPTLFKQHIIRTNLLTKFHDDRKINVTSRVLT
ncbi:hypothetical protein DPMN_172456, partial [Dreissena polymorpha]